MKKRNNVEFVGKKFNRLTAVRFVGKDKQGSGVWEFVCDCGNKIIIRPRSAISGHSKSCGCYKKEKVAENGRKTATHKMRRTRFYTIWSRIKSRCENPNEPSYKEYGGRGIKVLWQSFEDFRDDMYESYQTHIEKFGEKNTSIDRIDNNGNYTKGNCRWATQKEQCRNTRRNAILELNNERYCISEWAEKTGIGRATIWARINILNWSIEEALTKEVT